MAPATWGLNPARRVGNGAAGDGPEKGRCENRHLGRPAGGPAGYSQWEIDEKAACTRFLKKSTEEDEQDDVGRQHVGHDTEDPVLGQIERIDDPFQTEPAVGEGFRHVGSKEAVEDKADADQGKRPSQHPPGHLKGNDDADETHVEIQGRFASHPVIEGFKLKNPVEHRCRSGQAKKDVGQVRGVGETLFPPQTHQEKQACDYNPSKQDDPQESQTAQGRCHPLILKQLLDGHHPGVKTAKPVKQKKRGTGAGDSKPHQQTEDRPHPDRARRVQDEDQGVGQKDINAAVQLGGNRADAGGVEIEYHHDHHQDHGDPVPEAADLAGALLLLFNDFFDLFVFQ